MFVSGTATILHADLDAFYASVEQRDDPRLRGPPGDRRRRASCSPRATRRRRSASAPRWAGAQARRLCPHAIVVAPRMSAYSEASKAVFDVFDDTTPLVEGLSIDEAFLDVRGLERSVGTPVEIAARLRRDVRERVGLPITVGVARTKFLAKVASGVAKPDGLLVVPPDRELDVPASAPGRAALGRRAGDRRQAPRARDHDGRRRSRGSRRRRSSRCSAARRAATCTRSRTTAIRGRCSVGRRRGSIGSQRARGRARVVAAATSTPSSSRSSTASRGGCARRSGSGAPSCCGLRFDDFSRATRSHTLAAGDREHRDDPQRREGAARQPRCRRSSSAASRSSASRSRTSTTTTPSSSRCRSTGATGDALDAALDEVRERFGSAAITRAVLLGRDRGFTMPLLPD